MIASIKHHIALQFKRFLLVLTIALIFQPVFIFLDKLCDSLRFGEPSSLWQKLLQSYLIFYCLFVELSKFMSLSFQYNLLYGYLFQAVLVKFIYQRFFMERARVLWFQIATSIYQRQEAILSSGVYLLIFAATTKAIHLYKTKQNTKHQSKVNNQESMHMGE